MDISESYVSSKRGDLRKLFKVVPSLCITFLRELVYDEMSVVEKGSFLINQKEPQSVRKECQYKYRIKYKYNSIN